MRDREVKRERLREKGLKSEKFRTKIEKERY